MHIRVVTLTQLIIQLGRPSYKTLKCFLTVTILFLLVIYMTNVNVCTIEHPSRLLRKACRFADRLWFELQHVTTSGQAYSSFIRSLNKCTDTEGTQNRTIHPKALGTRLQKVGLFGHVTYTYVNPYCCSSPASFSLGSIVSLWDNTGDKSWLHLFYAMTVRVVYIQI